ncbi:MAG: efflux RND transporter periplasmic adaptor subunit [Rhodobacteraceae bacterium]|nr:efflux RND transporter periplasmic adaptor subunit [Paracoccaceae bacterium]
MRPIPLLLAALVIAALYALLFERERLGAFAGADLAAGRGEPSADPALTVAEEEALETAGGVAVVALRSEARAIVRTVRLRGRTEAARRVTVMAETSGRVISEPLRRGASVDAGQTLCRIDPGTRPAAVEEARARLAEAEARLAEARINDRAARSLSEGGFASETRVAAAEAAVRAAQAAVESARAGLASAEAELARTVIAAPFAGLLETDTAELGSLLQPGAPCAEVVRLDPIRLVGFVPETEVARIAPGAPASARLVTGAQVAGRVSFVSRAADEATRTFRVEVEAPNPDLAIRDGQTAEIAVSAEGERAHLLPASALTLDDAGRLGVRVAEGGTARFLPVTVLRDTPEGVWLTGLPEAADVIVVGQEWVLDGAPVAVTLREAAP